MGYRLGIDLGTTFTAAATDAGGSPRMVGLGNRALQVPSVLYLKDDGTFLCGEAAERRAADQPDRVVREFKRRLGDTVPMLVAGQPFSPQTLTAKLLAWVVATATEREGQAPDEVVLTHPANWGGFKRELFGQVASLADLSQVSTCAEPEAAAIQYASRAHLENGDRVVVYDLGGGTFDVCVLRMTEAGCQILGSPDGVEHLGGIDFDEAVFRHVLNALGDQAAALDPAEPEVTAGLIRMRRDCVEAKEALSSDVDAVVPVHLPGISSSVRLTRPELEALIEPAIGETLAATHRALRSADTGANELAAVVLVGGSSRIPLVSQRLQSDLGVRTAMDTHPKHDIALGAVQHRRGAARAHAAGAPEPAASRAVSTVVGWPTRDAGAPPTLAVPPAPVPGPAAATAVPRPDEADAASTQPLPVVTDSRPSPPPGRPERSSPSARETTPGSPSETPGRFGASSAWRWVAAGVGLAAVGGVAVVVLSGDGEGGSTGSGGAASRDVIAPGEVVVPLDRGEGIALYALDEEGNLDLLREPPSDMALTAPSLSPDRRFVYFREGSPDETREFTTKVLDLESGDVAAMVDDQEDLECIGRPAYVPGSTTVALLCREGNINVLHQGQQGEDGRITELEPIPDLEAGWANVAYLGTGELVATQGRNTESPGIYVGDPSDLRRLVSGETGATAASPFDDSILYEQDDVIWSVSADRSEPPCPGTAVTLDPVTDAPRCRLTDGGAGVDLKPAWEQVGEGETPERFVFVRSDDPDVVEGELLVYDLADGGEPQAFARNIGDVSGQPAWAHR